jgi:hypothetical protein
MLLACCCFFQDENEIYVRRLCEAEMASLVEGRQSAAATKKDNLNKKILINCAHIT